MQIIGLVVMALPIIAILFLAIYRYKRYGRSRELLYFGLILVLYSVSLSVFGRGH